MKKVELLAPAGSLEGFYGAVHAGADAVYLGGRKYGARAYAENFTDEQVCLAIRYAHLYGRKVYLTVNTLVKEGEIHHMIHDITPFYEEGLDGVIIQDMGVFSLFREAFPDLKIHGSTQMTVTGERGARFLLENGASRVVPARELSLEEIGRIKETGIEVEVFVHGAMCYGYSGQCLFSSLLGGRSGNRGRCAGPCRLPYEVVGDRRDRKKSGGRYLLSLKDLCALPLLDRLMDAGIDSFKIEGRMKKPEYSAGVTAIYRKYIDRYYQDPRKDFQIEAQDMENLKKLYLRSQLQEGYYDRHNGREMITLNNPGYAGADEDYIRQIRRMYLEQKPGIPVCGEFTLKRGKPMKMKVWVKGKAGEEVAEAEGAVGEWAKQCPVSKESVEKQLKKTGHTCFVFAQLDLCVDRDCFVTWKALNDLRKKTLEQLEETVQKKFRRNVENLRGIREDVFEKINDRQKGKHSLYLAVQIDNKEQLKAVLRCQRVDRIYADWGICEKNRETKELLQKWKREREGRKIFLALPCILRLRDEPVMTQMSDKIQKSSLIDGCLVRNLEELQWLKEMDYRGEKLLDGGLYVWNKRAAHFFESYANGMTAPFECNEREWRKLGLSGKEALVYGRIPLMVSANCVGKTSGFCSVRKKAGSTGSYLWIKDRYQTVFPVKTECAHCYNIIYNSVPLSLHTCMEGVKESGPEGVRLSFTTENFEETKKILSGYRRFLDGTEDMPEASAWFQESSFTKGHFKRGVE